MNKRICKRCGKEKDEKIFTIDKRSQIRSWICNDCKNLAKRIRRNTHPEEAAADNLRRLKLQQSNTEIRKQQRKDRRDGNPELYRARERNTRLKTVYGITLEEYDAMSKSQDGLCAGCNGLPSPGKRLHVDHDHKTGKIRELLCHRCNWAISRVEDVPGWAEWAVDYLAHHKEAS